jgi:hypothetical protein
MGAFGHFAALLAFSSTGYSPDVAANAVIGCGNPVKPAQQCTHHENRRFLSCGFDMAAVRGTLSGVPVSLVPGLPPCVQLPPFRVVTKVAVPRTQEFYLE